MICPSCNRRKAKRACPALGAEICTVCCGTKRLVEINCPQDCIYLTSARRHPPAVVQRQHERDARFLWPTVNGLTDPQYRLFIVLQDVIRRIRPSATPSLRDRDLADAAEALAATYETEERGIIYEHQAESLPAQRLAMDLKAALKEIESAGPRSFRLDAAEVLKRLRRGAADAQTILQAGDSSYLDLMERFLTQVASGAEGQEGPAAPASEPSRLILP